MLSDRYLTFNEFICLIWNYVSYSNSQQDHESIIRFTSSYLNRQFEEQFFLCYHKSSLSNTIRAMFFVY